MSTPSVLSRIHDYFFPHKRNEFRPHMFGTVSVCAIVIGVLALEGAYLVQIKYVFPNTDFLASVLPGALVALTNTDRTANDIPAVSENTVLDRAATLAAQDMAAKGYFSHVSPDGKDPWYWLDKVGYSYQYAGQNLAVNFTDSAAVEAAWMASPSHHANIVKSQYTQMGIGVANGVYEGKQTTFVVQFFAAPEASVANDTIARRIPKFHPANATTTKVTLALATTTSSAATTSAVLAAETPSDVEPVQAIGPLPRSPYFCHTIALFAPKLACEIDTATNDFLGRVVTAPTHTIVYILCTLALVILFSLIVATVVKVRVRVVEGLAAGLLLILIIIAALLWSIDATPNVQISNNTPTSVSMI